MATSRYREALDYRPMLSATSNCRKEETVSPLHLHGTAQSIKWHAYGETPFARRHFSGYCAAER